MPEFLFETAFVIPALIFVACAAAALFLLQIWRARNQARLAELRKADELLERHFRAAAQVVQDPETSKLIRSMVSLLTRAIGRRDIARGVALGLMDPDRRSLVANEDPPVSAAVLHTLQKDLRELAARRPDLVEKLDRVLEDGLRAMTLRWPETNAAVTSFMERQQKNASVLGIEEKSAYIVAAAPIELRQQYLLSVIPEAAAQSWSNAA